MVFQGQHELPLKNIRAYLKYSHLLRPSAMLQLVADTFIPVAADGPLRTLSTRSAALVAHAYTVEETGAGNAWILRPTT